MKLRRDMNLIAIADGEYRRHRREDAAFIARWMTAKRGHGAEWAAQHGDDITGMTDVIDDDAYYNAWTGERLAALVETVRHADDQDTVPIPESLPPFLWKEEPGAVRPYTAGSNILLNKERLITNLLV